MSENTSAATANVTPLAGIEAVEVPLTRRGAVTLVVTVEATTLADGIPSAEQTAEALDRLGTGQTVYVTNGEGSGFYRGTAVTIRAITLA